MSNNFKKFVGASLLTLAVVGGTTTYLNSTLKPAPVQYALDGASADQTAQSARHAEVIVTEGPAS
jgi:hypothetical protein